MHTTKRWLLRIFFAAEIFLFAMTFFFGSHGMHTLHAVQKETLSLQDEIVTLEREVAMLECDITQWHEDAFCKEKMAREQLQMARCEEMIYYIE